MCLGRREDGGTRTEGQTEGGKDRLGARESAIFASQV